MSKKKAVRPKTKSSQPSHEHNQPRRGEVVCKHESAWQCLPGDDPGLRPLGISDEDWAFWCNAWPTSVPTLEGLILRCESAIEGWDVNDVLTQRLCPGVWESLIQEATSLHPGLATEALKPPVNATEERYAIGVLRDALTSFRKADGTLTVTTPSLVAQHQRRIEWLQVTVDERNRTVSDGANVCDLSRSNISWMLFQMLSGAQGVYSREELLTLWGANENGGPLNLAVYISNLNKLISVIGVRAMAIRGSGYKLVRVPSR